MRIIILIVVLFNLQIFSQVSNNKFTFTASVGGGYASEASHLIYEGSRKIKFVDYLPDLSGKLGISYESFANIYDLNLGLAFEVGYFSASTPKYDFQLQDDIIKSIAKQRIIPITFSLLLDNDEILSPIIKIGFGLGNKKFTEEYDGYSPANVTAENWFFIIIGGTGLSYKISSSIELSLILEATLLKGKLYGENSIGIITGLQGLQTNPYFGLQIGYSINI